MIIIILTTMRMITKNENDCKNDDYNNDIHNYDHDNHDKENNEREKQKKKDNSARHYLRFQSDNVSDLRSNEHYLGSGV